MKLKQISECQPDGKISSFGYLVENSSVSPRNESEKTICNLGSLQAGGIQKLIELSNSISEFLLESVLKTNRDSITSSKSYGIVYLVKNLLEKNEITADNNIEAESQEKRSELFNFMISIMASLLECNIQPETKLTQISRQVYFPGEMSLNQNTLSELISSIKELPVKPSDNSEFTEYANKLVSWTLSDCGTWSEFDEAEGILRLSHLAGLIQVSAEEKTGLSWEAINNNLRHLHVIRLEKDNETILMTTRPSASQLKLFYQLDIEIPPNAFRESYGQSDQNRIKSIARKMDGSQIALLEQ